MPKSYQEFMKEKYPNIPEDDCYGKYRFGLEVWDDCVNNIPEKESKIKPAIYNEIIFESYTICGEKYMNGILKNDIKAGIKLNNYGKDDAIAEDDAKIKICRFILNIINRKETDGNKIKSDSP